MSFSILLSSARRCGELFSCSRNSRTAVLGRDCFASFRRRKNDACSASKSGTGLRGAGWKLHVRRFSTAAVAAGPADPPLPLASGPARAATFLAMRSGILLSLSAISAAMRASSLRRAASASMDGRRSSLTAFGTALATNRRWNLLARRALSAASERLFGSASSAFFLSRT